MSIDLNKHRDSIVAAWKDVVDDKTPTDWALFSYEGQTNDLRFISKGEEGLEELQNELNSGKIMYAFARVLDPKTSLHKCVLINWQGEGAPLVRKGTCANHIRDVEKVLKGAHLTINARNEEEVNPDVIIDRLSKSTGSAYSFKGRIGDTDRQTAPVGTIYKRVIPKNEINTVERDKFWQKEEEEERKRLAEERMRKEELKKIEKERLEKEAEKMTLERDSPEKAQTNNSSVRQEAEELIKMRKFDARAVFERNTSAGQLSSSRRSSDASSPVSDNESRTNTIKRAQVRRNDPPFAEPIVQHENTKIEEKETVLCAEPKVPVVEKQTLSEEDQLVESFLNGDDLGLKAEALYDYQAADETEISFDPGDIITHIEQIDPGWWQGLSPDGTFGLFPANYVELIE